MGEYVVVAVGAHCGRRRVWEVGHGIVVAGQAGAGAGGLSGAAAARLVDGLQLAEQLVAAITAARRRRISGYVVVAALLEVIGRGIGGR